VILIQKFKHSSISSGGALAKLLDIKVYSKKVSPKNKRVSAINWGLSSIPWLSEGSIILNEPRAVGISANKLKAFNEMSGVVNIPRYTTSLEEATSLLNLGKVVCRTKLTGSKGEGIVIASTPEELVEAGLYVLYIKKKWEYRVHVLQDEVVHIQQKRRLSTEQLEERGITDRSKYIRNLANGYIFSHNLDHNDGPVYERLLEQSLLSVSSLGLDFGAVDLIVTNDGQVFVLEVNTAPGLEGLTLERYVQSFRGILNV
jgi:hypothetical protein